MPRWDAGAEDRLRRAAMELYLERGFENVSVAQISERAGLTRRTFFRYFADKREVLFAGAERLPGAVTEAVGDADRDTGGAAGPLGVALRALRTVGIAVVEQVEHEHSRRRRAVIQASPDLQERERTKLAACTTALREALRARGTDDAAVDLVARVAIAVFETAMSRWAGHYSSASFGDDFDETVAEMTVQVSDATTKVHRSETETPTFSARSTRR